MCDHLGCHNPRASSTQDAQRDAKQMEPVWVNGSVHTARNIKELAFEFVQSVQCGLDLGVRDCHFGFAANLEPA